LTGIGLVVVVAVVVVVMDDNKLEANVLDADVGESVLLPCGSLDNSKFNFTSFFLECKNKINN